MKNSFEFSLAILAATFLIFSVVKCTNDKAKCEKSGGILVRGLWDLECINKN